MAVYKVPQDVEAEDKLIGLVLKQFRFVQVQKSVWVSDYDCKDYLLLELKQNKLETHIILYEALQLSA